MTRSSFRPSPALIRRGVLIGLLFSALTVLVDWIFPFSPSVPTSTMVTDRDGRPLTVFLARDDKWRLPVRHDRVSPKLIEAFINKEDRFFRWHPGVNPFAILRAAWNNVLSGRRTSGASTITMQVARLLEPRPRTLLAKLIETWHAIQLELHYSKDEILGLYLTLIPYGGNIEGVTSAAVFYFDREPHRLTTAETALLMVVPNRPTSLRLAENSDRLFQARNVWLREWGKRGLISEEEMTTALREPVSIRRIPTPRSAWHLSVRLRSAWPSENFIKSTIDRVQQERVESLTLNHVRRLQALSIYNAAVIVIDNRTSEVVSYVGSQDPQDSEHQGQVDGVKAVRSPGSTLKPFLYGLAIDRGLLTRRTTIEDVPVNYDGYSPTNFDERYDGLVTMSDALARSLNVPAVSTLAKVGIPSFLDLLEKGRLSTIQRDKKLLGLSVVLGGCGTRLDELTAMYASLARGGRYVAPRWTHRDVLGDTTQLLSAEASWILTDILLQRNRPDMPSNVHLTPSVPVVAWKTGTSYGRRDAWSIGYNADYTVGVWVGNFTGTGVPDLRGSTVATPLMFDVFTALGRSGHDVWHQRPSRLDIRYVCSVTGNVPGDSCKNITLDDFIPTVSPSIQCNHIREIFVNARGTISYCTDCLPNSGWKRQSFINLPPAILAFLRDEHLKIRLPPAHEPSCTRIERDGSISIVSVTEGKEYILEDEGERRLLLRCHASADATTVYWYLNDVFVTSAPPGGGVVVEPQAGKNTVTVTDNRGRSATVSFTATIW